MILYVENMKESIIGTRAKINLARLQNVRSIKIKSQSVFLYSSNEQSEIKL